MINIQYYSHLILQSRYSFIIKLTILLVFYSILYSNKVIFCMNEATNSVEAPIVAEAKETVKPSHQIIGIRRNIQAYAGSLATHLESRDQIIEESRQEIVELTQRLDHYTSSIQRITAEKNKALEELKAAKSELYWEKNEVTKLTRDIEGGGNLSRYREGYKKTISTLEGEISVLRRDLHISNALLDEAKRDKEKLFSLVDQAIKKR